MQLRCQRIDVSRISDTQSAQSWNAGVRPHPITPGSKRSGSNPDQRWSLQKTPLSNIPSASEALSLLIIIEQIVYTGRLGMVRACATGPGAHNPRRWQDSAADADADKLKTCSALWMTSKQVLGVVRRKSSRPHLSWLAHRWCMDGGGRLGDMSSLSSERQVYFWI